LRIAALAFGILAGLVASLILALGGLDAAALTGVDPRQLSLFRFGLFIIANFGVFGAGLVLAAPLAGAILLVTGAIAWIAAAFALHHGPDYVMLTPPGLLLLAAALAVVAFVRRPARVDEDEEEFGRIQASATQRAAMAAAEDQNEGEDEDEEPGAMPVGASFFGEAGTATNMHGAMARQPEPPRRNDDDWTPVRRRVEPPRTKPAFREPDDEYEDEESGFSRGARLTSSILSFGLYGALAAAAVLVFVNFRSGEFSPSATKIEASAAISSKVSVPSSSEREAARAPTLTASGSPAIVQATPVAPTLSPSSPGVTASSELSQQLAAERQAPLVAETSQVPAPVLSPPPSSAAPVSSEPPPEDLTEGIAGPTGPLMPFAMPSHIAAGRPTYPPPRRPAPARAPANDTGL
jgi:hypothetical protein